MLLFDMSVADPTKCWKVDGLTLSMKGPTVYSGSDCVVDVTIPIMTASYAPNKSIPLQWSVRLDADSTNVMNAPILANNVATLHSDTTVQILSTYVWTCTSRLQCVPNILDDTTAQYKNISISADATYFEPRNGLSFDEEGNYTVAAIAVLGNSDQASLLYYFQTFADIIVKDTRMETT